jgi:PAS domain S-box-containing protein
MKANLKTKLIIALGFLFMVIVAFGILGVYYINMLSKDADNIIKNNYETLVFNNSMLRAIDKMPADKQAFIDFELNLKKQERNITETGEKQATEQLRRIFDQLKLTPSDSSSYNQVRQIIQLINDINQTAIYKKNEVAKHTADNATFWLSLIFSILTLIAFTLVVNIPRVIATPVSALSEGIKEIAKKNYAKRIYLEQEDEFGDLAGTFNIMAEKLDEYEHSNLAKIKFEKSRIETIINQMKDGIIGLDEQKNILFMNAIAEKLLGLKEPEIIGKYAPDVALHNDLMRTLLQEELKTELKIFADAKESYFYKDVLIVTDNGAPIGHVIILRNITPFHELNEAKTNFIATVSHELKTPISSIKMSAKLLADDRIGNLNEEQKDLLQSIRDDSNRLLKITGELLNMSQVETGQIQLKIQPVHPSVIIEKALHAVQMQANKKEIQIKIAISDSVNNIYADVEKTSWVMINFLTNAIKYSSNNTVVEIAVDQKNNMVSFLVKDNGRGIEEKYLSKVFERYFKVPGISDVSGTGLGLAISKEFIEAEGGSIWVNSIYEQGSTFGFDLPSVA